MREASRIFQQKYWQNSDTNIQSFNKTLTNYVISFEQLGPDFYHIYGIYKSLQIQ